VFQQKDIILQIILLLLCGRIRLVLVVHAICNKQYVFVQIEVVLFFASE